MSKKTLLLCLCIVATLVIGLGSTLAYLTDTDTKVNTFTVGNVDIMVDENFEQNSPLNPGISVEKEARITNTGANPAWVWMTVAVPANVDPHLELGWKDGVEIDRIETQTGDDGKQYVVYTVRVDDPLAAGESTDYLLETVTLAPNVDYQNGEYVAIEDGQAKPIGEDLSKLDVIVSGYAVQTEGFTSVEQAYEAYHAQWEDETIPTESTNGDNDNVTFEAPAGITRVTNSTELKNAVAAGETTLLLAAGEYNIDNCGGKTLTLVGEDKEGTIINIVGGAQGEANGQLDYGLDSSDVTFQSLTIKSNNQTYAGFARLDGVYKDVHFVNTYCLNGNSEFEYCTFDITGDQYNIWTWGAPTATFDHCTFNCDGKAVLLYGTANTKLSISNSVFNDSDALEQKKTAVEIGNDYGKTYELKLTNVDVNGFAENPNGIATGTTLWSNKNSMGTDKLNVVVNGTDIY